MSLGSPLTQTFLSFFNANYALNVDMYSTSPTVSYTIRNIIIRAQALPPLLNANIGIVLRKTFENTYIIPQCKNR